MSEKRGERWKKLRDKIVDDLQRKDSNLPNSDAVRTANRIAAQKIPRKKRNQRKATDEEDDQ